MSLQVWLPLDGDLHNQGLANLSFISGSPSYKIGKIGANALNLNNRITFDCSALANLQTFSICFWAMAEPSSTLTTNWQDILGFTDVSSGGTNGTFRWETTYASADGIHWHDNATNALVNGSHNHITVKSIWVHCCVVFDNDAGKIYSYDNGVLTQTHNHAGGKFNSTGRFYLGETNNIEGKINDVRIYDHALSAKEVKEIAKGLVLHYKLDNNGGKPNNIKQSAIVNRGCTSFTYNSTNAEWTAVCPVSTSAWGVGFYVGDSSIKWGFGESWVISMEVYVPQTISWNADINNKPDLADISSYTGNDYDITSQRYAYTNGSNSKTLQIGWNKIWFSQTASNSTYGLSNYNTNWGIVTSSLSDPITIKIRNIKGEIIYAGEEIKPTNYVPNNLNMNNNIIYDTSGYNHAATANAITWSSPSTRYSVAAHFGSTSSKIHITNFPTSGFGNSYSFAWWGKRSSNSPMFWGFSDGIRLNGMYLGNLWNTGDSSNNPLYKIGTTTQVTVPSVNVWHHYVMTGNGTKCYVYLDGELWAEAKTYKAISGTSIYFNGWDSGTSYCSNNTDMSDFRIYATALSAEDIKELYNTSASIDNKGNIYAREVIEI